MNFRSKEHKHTSHPKTMSLNQFRPAPFFLEDDLYCSEEQWEDEEGDVVKTSHNVGCSIPLFDLPENELILSDDEELKQLFIKERQAHMCKNIEKDQALVESRYVAVDWILKVQAFYSFNALTAVLAVNYLDKFIFLSLQQFFQKDKPWMTQLAAVACLSLAAKVEEVHVPLLLDLQVEETKYVFEAKTIQKMEILILSTLEWKMNPVNPLTFLHQFTSKLGWSGPIYGDFIQRCELVILLALFDCRNVSWPPSVMAAATMLHVISSLQPSIVQQIENQIVGLLEINKEMLIKCSGFVQDLTSNRLGLQSHKRKFGTQSFSPASPTGVIDASFFSDNANGPWSAATSVISSPEPFRKRGRMDHYYLPSVMDDA